MAYRKRTLRKLPQVTRKLARLISQLDSISLRAKHILAEVGTLEADSRALKNHHCQDYIKKGSEAEAESQTEIV